MSVLPFFPIVKPIDLTSLKETGSYYKFGNIPYGEAPIGDLRFAAPIKPQTVSRTVNNGSVERVCYQAYADWALKAYIGILGDSLEAIKAALYSDARQTEDCLVLDVYVPTAVWNSKNVSAASVLVWIHGGGYELGSKSDSGNPSGLVQRSSAVDPNGQGVIFVSINYRLGMFGFLSGPDPDVTKNAGLLDQRLALEWVQEHIGIFGGDKAKVTVIGESAGGGGAVAQITAYGGEKGPAPFAKVIAQSAIWWTTPDEDGAWQQVLANASTANNTVSSVKQLRALDIATLALVNQNVAGNSTSTGYAFSPVIDGTFLPDFPAQLLGAGQFYSDVEVITGHNANESLYYFIANTSAVGPRIEARQTFLLGTSQDQLDYIYNTLYPEVLDGSYGYWSELGRDLAMQDEALFICNSVFLAEAFGDATHNYVFQGPPGTHGQDIAYTFYNNGEELDLANVAVVASTAHAMQDSFLAFAVGADPSEASGTDAWPTYGLGRNVQEFSATGVVAGVDAINATRCAYWQSGAWKA
ncbi:carboxylesterase family protein [Colletotrichum tofieldiae]|nr:carboxylesterase family protein [Colletotrichum tofieldiae]GKT79717.1 carboxylesterase family protein [Colletotrichum tofieldiae]